MPAYIYRGEQNTDGAHFGGVPLADLIEQEFGELPKHLRQAVAASPLYEEAAPSAVVERRAEAERAQRVVVADVEQPEQDDEQDDDPEAEQAAHTPAAVRAAARRRSRGASAETKAPAEAAGDE